MPRLDEAGLRRRLLESGLSPRDVRRTLAELNDHFDDLYEHERQLGADERTARETATRQLGDCETLVAAVRAHPELRGWAYRYPQVARLVYPLACVAALPAAPVIIGFSHGAQLARWVACLVGAGIVTVALLLLMQLTITLT